MTDTPWTPGPWKPFLTKDGRHVIGIGELTGDGVADCGFGIWRDGNEALANAHLIAAAPDLHEALDQMIFQFQADSGKMDDDQIKALNVARAALAKAKQS